MAGSGIEVFYDGDCPLCRNYSRMLRLKANTGVVELIDARGNDPRLDDLRRAGVDLNAGMVVRRKGRIAHGDEAIWLLSTLSDGGVTAWLLRSRWRARIAYPVLKAGRSLLLRILGRPRLD